MNRELKRKCCSKTCTETQPSSLLFAMKIADSLECLTIKCVLVKVLNNQWIKGEEGVRVGNETILSLHDDEEVCQ